MKENLKSAMLSPGRTKSGSPLGMSPMVGAESPRATAMPVSRINATRDGGTAEKKRGRRNDIATVAAASRNASRGGPGARAPKGFKISSGLDDGDGRPTIGKIC